MEKKNNNAEIDFNELERLAKCGGSDQGEIEPQSISFSDIKDLFTGCFIRNSIIFMQSHLRM